MRRFKATLKQSIVSRCEAIYLALTAEECYKELVLIFGKINAALCAAAIIEVYGEENC